MLAGFKSRWMMPVLVGGFERIGDLERDRARIIERHRPPADERRAIVSIDQFHHERSHARLSCACSRALLETVNLRDVRVVERCEHLRFTREPREPLGIRREQLRQHFQRDVPVQRGVARPVDLAHSTVADGGDDFECDDASS